MIILRYLHFIFCLYIGSMFWRGKIIIPLLLGVIFFLPLAANGTGSGNGAKGEGEYVVILHGIARSSDNMRSMANFLAKNGYEIINLDYPSTKYEIQDLARYLKNKLQNKITKPKKVNFVTHSMGGLVVRAYLNKYRPDNLGRIVMLAPPNKGSEIADILKDNQIYRKIYGPAGKQLTTNQQGLKEIFGKIDYELGIIAGDRSIDPISSAIIEGKDDGKVSIDSTKIEGMKDHIVLNATHTFIAQNKKVQKQVLHFLQNGYFFRGNED